MVRVGPEILHFQQAPQRRCCWSRDHTEMTGEVIGGAGSLIVKSSIHRNKLQTILKDLPAGPFKVRDLNSEYYKSLSGWALKELGQGSFFPLQEGSSYLLSSSVCTQDPPSSSFLSLPLPTPTLFTCPVHSI